MSAYIIMINFIDSSYYLYTFIQESVANTGEYTINPKDFHRKKMPWALAFEIGIVTVNITNPSIEFGILYAP
jgi:hypothetical protein